MSKFKLNQREKAWILYDVGNSAFTMLVSTLIPIYFNALLPRQGCLTPIIWPTGAMQAPLLRC